jgi:mono/diheme cytochrome c family protein
MFESCRAGVAPAVSMRASRYTVRCWFCRASLSACSSETGNSVVVPEQGIIIIQDINAARGHSSTTLPAGADLAQQPLGRESSAPAGPEMPLIPPSRAAEARRPPVPGNPQAGHDFTLGTCTPCHVVSPDQKSPVRFADAPDFRMIANASRTTAVGLNIWLTNAHPTMPKLVLDPQEAADVIAYILSPREQRSRYWAPSNR